MKRCRQCMRDLDDDAFASRGGGKRRSRCKECEEPGNRERRERWRARHPELDQKCRKEATDRWRDRPENREKMATRFKGYYSRNKETMIARARRNKRVNRDRYQPAKRKWDRKRRATDPTYRLVCTLRGRMAKAFHDAGLRKDRRADEYGIDYREIVEYLGPRPSPDSEVHHIVPLLEHGDWDFTDPIHVLAAFGAPNCEWRSKADHDQIHAANDRTDDAWKLWLLEWSKHQRMRLGLDRISWGAVDDIGDEKVFNGLSLVT